MKVAIHRDPNSALNFIEKWASALDRASIEVRWVNLRLPDAIDQVRGCDGVMWHWEYLPHERQVAPSILHSIEEYLEIPVFPDHHTCWHYDDKIAQFYIFRALKIPMPSTWIFWDPALAREWVCSTTYPKVFKLKTGSSSSNVHLVRTESEALRLIDLMFGPGASPRGFRKVSRELLDILLKKPGRTRSLARRFIGSLMLRKGPQENSYRWPLERGYVYFQDFLPGNSGDTRITVIGKRAFGFRRSNRSDDFRASGSKIIDFDPKKVDLETVRLAHQLSRRLRAQSMAYDFLVGPSGRLVVTEMSYIYADWAIDKCEGYWDSDLVWVPGHTSPQTAHVEDFIARLRDQRRQQAVGNL
jgi:hypothetical protein